MTTAERLTTFIQSELLSDSGAEIAPDDDLLLSGLIDSIGVMSLLAFIETDLGIHVPPQDVTIENFSTVETMDGYLAGRQDAVSDA